MNNKEKNAVYKNSLEMIGNISSIGDVMKKTNGNEFRYINIAQNDVNGKASFYSVYLDGKMLEEFNKNNYKVGERIKLNGKLESYQKDSKVTLQIRPFEMNKAPYEKTKENNQAVSKTQDNGIEI